MYLQFLTRYYEGLYFSKIRLSKFPARNHSNLMMFNGGSWLTTFEKSFIRRLTFASLVGYFEEFFLIKTSTILKPKCISLAMKGMKTKNKVKNPQELLSVWMKLKAV